MLRRVIVFWTAWLAILVISMALAVSDANAMIELKRVYITYRYFTPGGTDPFITQNALQPGKQLGRQLDLSFDSNIFDYLYWNSRVTSLTDKDADGTGGQFRFVGLDMGLGVDFRRVLDLPFTLGLHHFSGHTLDTQHSFGHFPVQDSIEFNLFLYERASNPRLY